MICSKFIRLLTSIDKLKTVEEDKLLDLIKTIRSDYHFLAGDMLSEISTENYETKLPISIIEKIKNYYNSLINTDFIKEADYSLSNLVVKEDELVDFDWSPVYYTLVKKIDLIYSDYMNTLEINDAYISNLKHAIGVVFRLFRIIDELQYVTFIKKEEYSVEDNDIKFNTLTNALDYFNYKLVNNEDVQLNDEQTNELINYLNNLIKESKLKKVEGIEISFKDSLKNIITKASSAIKDFFKRLWDYFLSMKGTVSDFIKSNKKELADKITRVKNNSNDYVVDKEKANSTAAKVKKLGIPVLDGKIKDDYGTEISEAIELFVTVSNLLGDGGKSLTDAEKTLTESKKLVDASSTVPTNIKEDISSEEKAEVKQQNKDKVENAKQKLKESQTKIKSFLCVKRAIGILNSSFDSVFKLKTESKVDGNESWFN